MNMIFNIFTLSCLLLMSPPTREKISFKGEVSFTSDAPLEVIRAKSDKLIGIIDPVTGEFAFSVKLKTFNGFNSALQQEHFHENYMRTSLYPTLSYSGKLLDKLDEGITGNIELRTKGKFYINGVYSERILKHKVRKENQTFIIESDFTIRLADHHILIPKIVHKKIAEEIHIHIYAYQVAD